MPARLQVDAPAEFGEFFLDVGERIGQSGAAVGAGGALGEDAFALEFEGLALALAIGLFEMRGCCGRFRRRRVGWRGGLRCFLSGFDGFALPAS